MTDYIAQLIYKGIVAIFGLSGATFLGATGQMDGEAVAAIYSGIVMYTLANGYKSIGKGNNGKES